jgi:hypothetical protein
MTISDDSADAGHPGWMDYPSIVERGRRAAMSGRTASRAIRTLVEAKKILPTGVKFALLTTTFINSLFWTILIELIA